LSLDKLKPFYNGDTDSGDRTRTIKRSTDFKSVTSPCCA